MVMKHPGRSVTQAIGRFERAGAVDSSYGALTQYCLGGILARVEVIYTDEFGEWFAALSKPEQDEVIVVVGLLEGLGVALGFPASSALRGSRVALRELRPKRGRSPIRVIYAFDPDRDAVLLIGGDKSGGARFYERLIPVAEKIWAEYLAEHSAGKHRKKEQP